MAISLRLRLFLFAALLVSGCGFHLRGLDGQKSHVAAVFVVAANDAGEQAVSTFKEVLQNNGIALARDPQTPWKVVLDTFIRNRNQMAIGGQAFSTREIQLTDGYRMTVFKNGKPLGSLPISSRTNVEYSSGQYIGSAEEEENAHRQLAEENAHAALHYLDSLAVQTP